MTCRSVMDIIYESAGDKPLPLRTRLEVGLHLLFCPRCAQEAARLEAAWELLGAGFPPPTPDLEAAIMAEIYAGEADVPAEWAEFPEKNWVESGGVTTRGWAITGLIILFSLSTSFLGLNFGQVAASEGSSFLLPLGLTIGLVVTSYGAIFIGSHLKELSARFRLHS
jgi:hypothetical protein